MSEIVMGNKFIALCWFSISALLLCSFSYFLYLFEYKLAATLLCLTFILFATGIQRVAMFRVDAKEYKAVILFSSVLCVFIAFLGG